MQGARNGQDISRTNAAETASRGSNHSRSILEGAGRNRVTILRCQPRAEATYVTLSDNDKTGTSTAEDDRYDNLVGRRHRATISERNIRVRSGTFCPQKCLCEISIWGVPDREMVFTPKYHFVLSERTVFQTK